MDVSEGGKRNLKFGNAKTSPDDVEVCGRFEEALHSTGLAEDQLRFEEDAAGGLVRLEG